MINKLFSTKENSITYTYLTDDRFIDKNKENCYAKR